MIVIPDLVLIRGQHSTYSTHRSVGSRGLGGHGLPDFADIEKRTEAEIDKLLVVSLQIFGLSTASAPQPFATIYC